ncbi:hypothetical protein EAP82_01905 [Salmonella enterica]|nr:hypothetical protein [Salmonella enterica]EBF4783064.1 hypothetical protein [Salmonella enterica subsp. diarizonae]EAO3105211.1 hypothetical protein [Salmonella enterica]EAO7617184.1 hypothetical protein [Salmonella enterica]EAP3672994.1 hypothetical protein [Salmonella enterica]
MTQNIRKGQNEDVASICVVRGGVKRSRFSQQRRHYKLMAGVSRPKPCTRPGHYLKVSTIV